MNRKDAGSAHLIEAHRTMTRKREIIAGSFVASWSPGSHFDEDYWLINARRISSFVTFCLDAGPETCPSAFFDYRPVQAEKVSISIFPFSFRFPIVWVSEQ
jgi:hypothetical protein